MDTDTSFLKIQRENKEEIRKNGITFPGICLFVYIIWQSLVGFVIHFDAAARIPYTMIFIAFLTILKKIPLLPKDMRLYIKLLACLFLFHICNVFLQGSYFYLFQNNPLNLLLSFISKWCFVCILLCELKENIKSSLILLILAHFLVISLYVFHSETAYMAGLYERMSTQIINANQFAFTCISGICILFLMNYLNYISNFLCCALYIWLCYIVMKTGCRTAFSCLFPLSLYFLVHLISNQSNIKQVLIVASTFALFCFLFPYILNSTVVQRFENRTQEAEALLVNEETVFLSKILGERAVYVYTGYELFKQSPFYGVGYGNYIEHSDFFQRNHIEYMAELCEGGIIGFSLYLLGLLSIVKGIWASNVNKTHSFFLLKMTIYIALLMFSWGLFTSVDSFFYVIVCLLFSYPQTTNNTDQQMIKGKKHT